MSAADAALEFFYSHWTWLSANASTLRPFNTSPQTIVDELLRSLAARRKRSRASRRNFSDASDVEIESTL
jgi:hypothetical protein